MPELTDELAAMIYYDRVGIRGKILPGFETLTQDVQKPFKDEALRFINRLEKMDKIIISRRIVQEDKEKEEEHLEVLTRLIQKFVYRLNTARPQLFPCGELARLILKGG